ncbi:flagellar hook-associated protein FlgK [Maribius pontilimi]|uniref:Flagellar hook-associated protein 1 n=1 Tax=Palleronia pontilimi TaxID=1964209 RepID=A0A934IGK0_9RHOB|nr:flagellar hook-associated protein FlgK [Palleronia pontilimi]MBJ3761474.1 flagellar hook-associated protein FlgK [Palleronia pontilimi]
MSISVALNAALSGLGAAGRSAQVVSSNISNALTPGYARREIDLSGARYGGVEVAGVTRAVSGALLGERRASEAETGFASTRSAALTAISDALGAIGDTGSLSGRVARFDALLLESASQPDSSARLNALADGARDLASFFNRASDDIQTVRLRADRQISDQVDALNAGLARIDELNGEILKARFRGGDTNQLKDLRQREIDQLATIVPLREMPRPNDAVALVTLGGQILLEDSPVQIDFSRASAMSATASLGTPLSGLSINGIAVDMTNDRGRMSGGSLQAAFDVRDQIGPQGQARLDGLARDLIERMSGLDPTLAAGDPGLFTDDGGAFLVANEPGLASRLALNAAADPKQGGEAWRLRDGLGAALPGPQGDAALLQARRVALTATSVAGSAALGTASLGFGGQADDAMGLAGAELFRAQDMTVYAENQLSELMRQELVQGVDTDAELQNLLLIEQIYGANTKVMQAADAMLSRLLEI